LRARPRCLDREEGHRARHHYDHRPQPAQRLYELVRNHLGSIEDFFVALERTKDFARAERLGLEFAEDFR
jgi:hypothetical protein